MFTIETAKAALTSRETQNDRDTIRAAAEFLIDNQSQLTGRAVATLTQDELYDPAWSKVVQNTFSPCNCGDPECHANAVRVIGPALCQEIAADQGRQVIVPVAQQVYIAKVGSTKPQFRFYLESADRANRRTVHLHIISQGRPVFVPFAQKQELLEMPVEARTLHGSDADHLPEPAVRIDNVTDDSIVLFVDNGYTTVNVRDNLEEDSRVTVSAEKVYLRPKGAGEDGAVIAFWTDAAEGVLLVDNDPLNPMGALAAMFGGGPKAMSLTKLAEQMSGLPADQRTVRARDGFSPMCMFVAFKPAEGIVELAIDKEFEVYTPNFGEGSHDHDGCNCGHDH